MNKPIKKAIDEISFNEERKEAILDILLSECDLENRREIISMFKKKKMMVAAILITVMFTLTGAAYAALHYLSAKEVTQNLGSEELSHYFQSSDVEQICEIGDYRFAYLGVAASVKLSEQFLGNTNSESTYIVVAAQRIDGKPIMDESFVASPLIQGLDPFEYNIYSMGGGATYYVENGIYYMVVCCDSIEMFADKKIYLAITEGPDYKSGYEYDASTGLITRNENFKGVNALFTMNLDESKADPQAQQKYIESINQSTMMSSNIPLTGYEDVDFFLNYDYASLSEDKIDQLQQLGTTIDDNAFSVKDGYYSIKFENEYGSSEGTILAETYDVNAPRISLCSYDTKQETYVLLQYEIVDIENVLHIKYIRYDKSQLVQAMELLLK